MAAVALGRSRGAAAARRRRGKDRPHPTHGRTARRSTATSAKRCGCARRRSPTSIRSRPSRATHRASAPRSTFSTTATRSTSARGSSTRSPSSSTPESLRQGQAIGADDRFFVHIDPFNNRRSGYLFGVNPNGVRYDGIFEGVTQRQFDWDGIWQAAARVTPEGWVARDRDPVQDAVVRSVDDELAHEFRAQHRAQERGNGVDLAQSQHRSLDDGRRDRYLANRAGPRPRRRPFGERARPPRDRHQPPGSPPPSRRSTCSTRSRRSSMPRSR